MPPKILFISRSFPPTVGGIENQNHALSVWLGKHADVTTVANRWGKKFLPIFLPYCFIRALFCAKRFDAILLGDSVLAIVGWFIKILYPRKAVLCVVHGLDITYPFFFYQALWIHVFLPKLDRLIAVGNETIAAGIARNIPKEKFEFIPNGIDPSQQYNPQFNRRDLEGIVGDLNRDTLTILTSGRLAKRKGVAWFIQNVLPNLPGNTLYIIAGNGPDIDNIRKAVEKTGLFTRVKILGYVSDRARDILLNTCDIFVQPNISVPDDMEGFGISVIEAASCGIPVVTSKIEGLKDAIADGKNGIFAESENHRDWIKKLDPFLSDKKKRESFGDHARKYTVRHFDWNTISACYSGIIQDTINRQSDKKVLKIR